MAVLPVMITLGVSNFVGCRKIFKTFTITVLNKLSNCYNMNVTQICGVFQLVVKWEMVAYGTTKDQLELTEQAHLLLGQTKFKPRALTL